MIVSDYSKAHLAGLGSVSLSDVREGQKYSDRVLSSLTRALNMPGNEAKYVALRDIFVIQPVPENAILRGEILDKTKLAIAYVRGAQVVAWGYIDRKDPIAYAAVKLYNEGKNPGEVWLDVFKQLTDYYRQDQAARGRLSVDTAREAYVQWQQDTKISAGLKTLHAVANVVFWAGLAWVGYLAVVTSLPAAYFTPASGVGAEGAATTAATTAAETVTESTILGVTTEQAGEAALLAYQISEQEKAKQHAKDEQQKQEALALAAQQQAAQQAALQAESKPENTSKLWMLGLAAVTAFAAFM